MALDFIAISKKLSKEFSLLSERGAAQDISLGASLDISTRVLGLGANWHEYKKSIQVRDNFIRVVEGDLKLRFPNLQGERLRRFLSSSGSSLDKPQGWSHSGWNTRVRCIFDNLWGCLRERADKENREVSLNDAYSATRWSGITELKSDETLSRTSKDILSHWASPWHARDSAAKSDAGWVMAERAWQEIFEWLDAASVRDGVDWDLFRKDGGLIIPIETGSWISAEMVVFLLREEGKEAFCDMNASKMLRSRFDSSHTSHFSKRET